MAHKNLDAVHMRATGTGTGSLTPTAVISNRYRTLDEADFNEGDSTYVHIQHETNDSEWEIVLVTLTGGLLVRTFDSGSVSKTGALINFSAGNKIVSTVWRANQVVAHDKDGNAVVRNNLDVDNDLNVDGDANVDGNLDVGIDLTVAGDAIFDEDVSVAGNVSVTGDISANDLTLTGNIIGSKNTWYVLASSFVSASVTGTLVETQLAAIAIPALGLNSVLRITTLWSYTNSANTKNLRVRFSGSSGTTYFQSTATTTASFYDQRIIANANSFSSQKGTLASPPTSASAQAIRTSTVDTSVPTTLYMSGLLTNTGETITLEGYLIELYHGA